MLPELHQAPDVYTLGIQFDAEARPWWRYSDGTLLPVIAGGADDDGDTDDAGDDDEGDGDTTDDTDSGGDGDDTDDDEPLGPKGKKALDAEKARRRKEAERRRSAETRARELEQQLEKLKKSGDDKDAPDADAIREEARREAQRETLRDRTLDRIEARAGSKFADPEDARAILAARVEDFIDGSDIDNDAIAEALDELLEKKPHLAVKGRRKFDGGADGGAKKDKKKPAATLEEAIAAKYAGKT